MAPSDLIPFVVQKGINLTIAYEAYDNMVTFHFEKTIDENKYAYVYSVLLFEIEAWTDPIEAMNCILDQAEYVLKQQG